MPARRTKARTAAGERSKPTVPKSRQQPGTPTKGAKRSAANRPQGGAVERAPREGGVFSKLKTVVKRSQDNRPAPRGGRRERPTDTVPKAATSSSTLAAHRPTAGPVPTPWAKVATGSAANVTTRMQERLRERRTARTRLLALRWAKRVAIAGAAVGAGWVVLMSPLLEFDAEKMEAVGHGSVVDPAAVESVVAAHNGTSMILLDTGGIAAELEGLVGVRDASVQRVWPAGLRIAIESAEPVAAIPREGGGFVLVDDRGEQVDSAEQPPDHLPVVTIPITSGETRILDGVLAVIDELPVTLRDRVGGVEAKTEDSIQFVLRDGPRVEWGSGEQSPLKAEVLQVLLDSPEASSAAVIDVSAPSLPITRAE